MWWPRCCNSGWTNKPPMAEDKFRASLRCILHYRPDRHASEKLAQVYNFLAPLVGETDHDLKEDTYEQDSSHLCASLLRPAEGAEHHRQPDQGPAGLCPNQPVYDPAGMDL